MWTLLYKPKEDIAMTRAASKEAAMNDKDVARVFELVIDNGPFTGQIVYSCSGMRYACEEETFFLEKGDNVWIERKDKKFLVRAIAQRSPSK